MRAVCPAIYVVALALLAWVSTLSEPYSGLALTPTLWFGLFAPSLLPGMSPQFTLAAA
ncbi:hypothetical protein [Hyalangium sp.]|uniref:hypothetical protein n=1 Tax=Hyalangium sp. TaxID=2028555 RepID=UPI00389A5F30